LVSEEKVAYEGEDWRVEGRADLLAEVNGGLAVLDLKSGQRPAADAEIVDKYRKQLALCGLMVERNRERQVENLSVYWMDEDLGSDAVMEVEDTGAAVLEARNLLGCTVEKIKARDFAVSRPPDKEVCQRCELHTVCKKEGIFICPQA
jgi:CRISPR/Cas system-associated exonuclease Cas4 (RecB family)